MSSTKNGHAPNISKKKTIRNSVLSLLITGDNNSILHFIVWKAASGFESNSPHLSASTQTHFNRLLLYLQHYYNFSNDASIQSLCTFYTQGLFLEQEKLFGRFTRMRLFKERHKPSTQQQLLILFDVQAEKREILNENHKN